MKGPAYDGGRSKLLINILSYNVPLHLVGCSLLTLVAVLALQWTSSIKESIAWGVLWTYDSFWILPLLIPGTLNVLSLLSPFSARTLYRQPKARTFRKLYICLVTRGTNQATVHRSVTEMQHLRYLDSRIQFVVLTESGPDTNFPGLKEYGVEVVQVPKTFRSEKAKYKARALEYFRRMKAFGDEDWVLHLDEETAVDDHCVLTCLEFIEREVRWDYGQGIIAYNTVNYWKNYLLTFAEIVRFRDDIGRFQFAHNMLHFPLYGYHGSFLLVRGAVENAVTWETDCLAEDYWFAQQAWNKGFYGGFIPSIAREQSNYSFSDLHRQRRRWFCGMWTLGWAGRMNVLLWTLSNIEPLIGYFAFSGHLHLPLWLSAWVCVYIGSGYWSVAISTYLQDLDARIPPLNMLLHLLLMPIVNLGVSLLQISCVAFSILKPVHNFQIVAKQ